MSNALIKRKSLSSGAFLGALYDARNDRVLSNSLFNLNALTNHKGLIQTIDSPSTNYKFSLEDSYESKFEILNVQAQLKASFFAFMCDITLEGAGKFLQDQKKSQKTVKGNLSYEMTTKRESISLTDTRLREHVARSAFEDAEATHVVTRISWGGVAVASFEYSMSSSEKKETIEGSLGASLRKFKMSISGGGQLQLNEEEKKIVDHMSIQFYGDFVLRDEQIPQTAEETINIMRRMCSYVNSHNNGKGVPVELELTPLDQVAKIFQQDPIERIFVELEEATIISVQRQLDYILNAKQSFYDLKSSVEHHRNLILDQKIREVDDFQNNILVKESNFRNELAELLLQIRRGEKKIHKLEQLIQKLVGLERDIRTFLSTNSAFVGHLDTLQTYSRLGIVYLGKNTNLRLLALENRDKDIYVLAYSESLKEANQERYRQNDDLFMNLYSTRYNQNTLFWIYDFELNANPPVEPKIAIHFYRNGQCYYDDFYQIEEMRRNNCIARCQELERGGQIPNDVVNFRYPCPRSQVNEHRCPRLDVEWTCEICESPFKIDCPSLKLYCECGNAKAALFEFKCKERQHPEATYFKWPNKGEFETVLRGKYPMPTPPTANQTRPIINLDLNHDYFLPSKVIQRIKREIQDFQDNPPANFALFCVPDNLRWIEATIKGPEGSPYEGGIFHLRIHYYSDYPFKPPIVFFTTKIFHPNINPRGQFCSCRECPWKHFSPDGWTPRFILPTLLAGVYSMLERPSFENMTNLSARGENYQSTARQWTREYAVETNRSPNANNNYRITDLKPIYDCLGFIYANSRFDLDESIGQDRKVLILTCSDDLISRERINYEKNENLMIRLYLKIRLWKPRCYIYNFDDFSETSFSKRIAIIYYKNRAKISDDLLNNLGLYWIKDIWSTINNSYLNKKIQFAFKISTYFFSFIGIFLNSLTIIVIVKKDNSDLFKEFIQYSYLV